MKAIELAQSHVWQRLVIDGKDLGEIQGIRTVPVDYGRTLLNRDGEVVAFNIGVKLWDGYGNRIVELGAHQEIEIADRASNLEGFVK